MVRHLYEKGANIDARNFSGHTALHLACQLGCNTIIKFLLDNKADINALNEKGEDALIHAIFNGNFESCELLLEGGININRTYYDSDFTALDLAIMMDNKELGKLLESKGIQNSYQNYPNDWN